MSVEAYKAVWDHFEGTQRQRVLMLALANRADEHGIAWPSIDHLEKKTRMKRSTVYEVLREVEKSGQLVTLEGGGGRGVQSLRWLKLPTLDGDTSEAEQRIKKGPKARRKSGTKKGPEIRNEGSPKGSEGSEQASNGTVRTPAQKGSEDSDSLSIGETSEETSEQQTVDSVQAIYDFWKQATRRNGTTQLTPGRRAAIKARLDEGRDPAFIKRAITKAAVSPFHQGKNDRRQRYDDLTLICRNGEKLEQFAELGVSASAGGTAVAAPPDKPGEPIVESAEASAAWEAAKTRLQSSLPTGTWHQWVAPFEAAGERGTTLVLVDSSDQGIDRAWAKRYRQTFLDALEGAYTDIELIDETQLEYEAR